MYITSDNIICDPAHKTGDCGGGNDVYINLYPRIIVLPIGALNFLST